MRFALATNIVSPHQIPLALELAKSLGETNFRYIAMESPQADRARLGWHVDESPVWLLKKGKSSNEDAVIEQWLNEADVLLTGYRNFSLFEHRSKRGLISFYMSERWFKPPIGIARIFHPRYLRMGVRLKNLLATPKFYYLPMGVYAAMDMSRLVTLLRRLNPYSTLPRLSEKQLLWGYFVDQSNASGEQSRTDELFKILWFGRFLKCKNVDLLLRALRQIRAQTGCPVRLKLIGTGLEEAALRQLAAKLGIADIVEFHPPKLITEIRTEIRNADVCVVTSNGQEGWGVAVNEGLIEGRCMLVSDATGGGSTLIQDGVNGLLFKSGDADDLAQLLQRVRIDKDYRMKLAMAGRISMLSEWTPAVAAERLLALSEDLMVGRELTSWTSGPLSRL